MVHSINRRIQRICAQMRVLVCGTLLPLLSTAQINYEPEFTQIDLATRVIDVTKPVGAINGAAGVSATGAATYSIAITVPPGTNGVQPTLALTYSSHAGDGFIGYGWDLSCASAITRTGRDQYHDQLARPIEFTADDRFSLDGQRLVMTSAGTTYGDDGAVYDTEQASFAEVISHGSTPTGPDHFTVTTKAGMRMEFGTTSDARVAQPNGVLSWLLNKVIDPFGNYMTYTYEESDLQVRLKRIDYTANDAVGITAYNSVEMVYSTDMRPDLNEQFVVGYGKRSAHLLESIVVECEGLPFKRYDLNYCQRLHGHSYLREVTEYGADDATSLNSTWIRYGGNGPLLPFSPHANTQIAFDNDPGPESPTVEMYSSDIDGDGIDELLVTLMEPDETPLDLYFPVSIGVYKWNGHWFYPTGANIPLSGTNTLAGLSSDFPSEVKDLGLTDFNGDGRGDVMVANHTYVITGWYGTTPLYSPQLNSVTIHYSNTIDASGFASTTYPAPSTAYVYGRRMLAGDFNGDGISDYILVLVNSMGSWESYFSSPEIGVVNQPIVTGGAITLANQATNMVVNFDGDQALEILNTYATTTRVFKLRRPGEGGIAAWHYDVVYDAGYPQAEHDIRFGDFNADGLTDLLTRCGTCSDWNIGYGTGQGFMEVDVNELDGLVDLDPLDDYQLDALLTPDVNGDGMSDIVHLEDNGTSAATVRVLISRGLGFGFELAVESYYNDVGYVPIFSIDADGDGQSEVINYLPNVEELDLMKFHSEEGDDRLVAEISDGLSRVDRFQYALMTNPTTLPLFTPIHERGTTFAYPNGSCQFPVYLTAYAEARTGVSIAYEYYDAKMNREGRGLLGFEGVQATNSALNALSIEYRTLNEDYACMLPSLSKLFKLPNEQLKTTQYDIDLYGLGDPAAKRYAARPMQTIATDHLTGSVVTTTNVQWDASGNVVTSVTDIDGIVETEVHTMYLTAGLSPALSKPFYSMTLTTRAGSPTIGGTQTFAYDPATGRLETKVDFAGTPKQITTTYGYHWSGLVHTISESTAGMTAPREQWFVYDDQFRFATTTIRKWDDDGTPVDLITISEFDPRWGMPTSVLTPDGLKQIFEYDAFGNMTAQYVPHVPGAPRTDNTIFYDRQWAIGDYPTSMYYEYIGDPSKPHAWTFKDAFGRTVHTEVEGYGHDLIFSDAEYDILGNLTMSTTMHESAEPFTTTTYSYDDYNMVENVESSVSGITTYTYDYGSGERKVTVATPAGWSARTTDATGQTIRTEDPGGEVTYDYDGWGNALQVKVNGSTTVTNAYDEYGRQNKMIDVDGGTSEYEYDAFGQLVWQKDPNQNETTIAYDNLGRMVERNGVEGTTTYQYFFDGVRALDAPSTISGPEATHQFFYIDQYNRLTSELVSMDDGSNHLTEYGYDPFDRLAWVRYPSGVQVDNTYTLYGGFLDRVSVGSTVLFDATDQNGSGQYTEYTLADQTNMTVTYDHGFPVRYHGSNTPDVQDLNLSFDPFSGNLLHRWDKVKDRREEFNYDALNRLVSSLVASVDDAGFPISGPAYTNQTYTYDGSIGLTRGNVRTKSDIGLFGHGGVSRVISATNLTYPYPSTTPPTDINLETQLIEHTPFGMPSVITETFGTDDYVLNYHYGPAQQRTRSVLLKNGAVDTKRWYVGAYEKQEYDAGGGSMVEQHVHYVAGGDGLCAIVVKQGTATDVYPVYKDHLGSILTATRPNGTTYSVVAEQNFDAWGRDRHPTQWLYHPGPAQPAWLFRGFTGHESCKPFGLINMNARLYDPATSRMLAPDILSMTSSVSGSNRYAYAGNNPTGYVDPSGNMHFLVPVAAGLLVGGWAAGVQDDPEGDLWLGDWDWDADSKTAIANGAILGAAAGIAYAGVHSALGWGSGSDHWGMNGIGKAGGIASGATTRSWDIISNSLTQGGINVLSARAQNRDEDDVLASGAVGLLSGALGGYLGYEEMQDKKNRKRDKLTTMAERVFGNINYRTAMLNGGLDRFVFSARNNGNPILDGAHGIYDAIAGAATVQSLSMGIGAPGGEPQHVLAIHRYSTQLLTQAVSATPGMGVFIATPYGVYSATAASWRGSVANKVKAVAIGLLTYDVATGILSGPSTYPWAVHPFGSYNEPWPFFGLYSGTVDWFNNSINRILGN